MRFEFLNIKGMPLSVYLPIVNSMRNSSNAPKSLLIAYVDPSLRRDQWILVHSECQSYKFSAVFLSLTEIGTSVSLPIGTIVLSDDRAAIPKNHEAYILRRE